MPSVKELRESRANTWSQMTGLMDEAAKRADGQLTAEERRQYDDLEKELDRLGDEADLQERHAQREASMRKVDRGELPDNDRRGGDRGDVERRDGESEHDARYRSAFDAYMRNGSQDLSGEQREVLRGGMVDPAELRAQGVATGAAGGYAVPPAFRNKIIEVMKQVGNVRAVADHIDTESGVNLPWPTLDDTNNVGAILGENTQVTDQDFTLGQASLDAYMYTSKQVRLSWQLLQDAGFDLEARLARLLGTRIGRIQNMHFTTGTGVSQPDGIATGAVVAKQGATGQTTTVTYDDLVDLTDGVDPAYLGGDNCGWMFGQTFRRAVRKLKDSQNRPLWEPSVQAGSPDLLLGYGITLNNDMPAPAASAKSALFGDFREGYVVRDVLGITLVRLVERYADFAQTGFIAFARADGTVQNTAAYKAYQHSAT